MRLHNITRVTPLRFFSAIINNDRLFIVEFIMLHSRKCTVSKEPGPYCPTLPDASRPRSSTPLPFEARTIVQHLVHLQPTLNIPASRSSPAQSHTQPTLRGAPVRSILSYRGPLCIFFSGSLSIHSVSLPAPTTPPCRAVSLLFVHEK